MYEQYMNNMDRIFTQVLKQSKQWVECSEIIIYPVQPKQEKRCYSTITDHLNKNAITTFESHKNSDKVGLCKRIIVNASNKEIRILINALMQIQIVGSNWEAFIK